MAENSPSEQEATNWQFVPTKVLVVDDQSVIRASIRRILEKMGPYEIFDFHNGNTAIAFMQSHPIDLVIADIYMDKGDGFDILNYVRNRQMASDIPVIFVSGEATKDDIVHAIDLKVTDYIIKPFEPSDFSQKIQQVLNRYHVPTAWEQEMRKAEELYFSGRIDESRQVFQETIAKGDHSPRALSGIAQCYLHMGDHVKAIDYLTQAIQSNGLYFPAHALLADLYLRIGNKDKAKESLLKELSINGKQAHRRILLANLYAAEEQPEKALEEMRKALMDSPKDERSLLFTASLLAEQGNIEKAVHYYIRTRKSHPDCYEALQGIISCYEKANMLKKADQLFKDLVRLHPKQKDLLLARSHVFELEEEYEAALKDIDMYVGEFPEHLEGLKQRFRILSKLKRYGDALTQQKAVLAMCPSAENYSKAGITCIKSQQFVAAARYYEKAVSLEPQNRTYCFNLGYALEMVKLYSKARLCYKRVLELAPNHKDATIALKRVENLIKLAQAASAAQEQASKAGPGGTSSRHFTGDRKEEYPDENGGKAGSTTKKAN